MPQLHILRVFCDAEWEFGNPLGVFLDGGEVPEDQRVAVAAELGYSETVFVDDPAEGRIRIFTPCFELGFAGHPTVGTAWLLAKEREPVETLRPPGGDVKVRVDGDLTFVAARPEWGPAWELFQLADPKAVEESPDRAEDTGVIWAWIDEAEGTVRSRCFTNEDGVGEDEATGSAAIVLCAALERDIDIFQGRGSRLDARWLGDGRAEVGGRVILDEVREFSL